MARAHHLAVSARRWAGMALAYFLSSGAVQLLGAVSTFLYVRMLDTDHYALLALCLTTMAFIALTTDLGLTGSLNYFKRRSLQQNTDFGRYVALVQRMRLTLFPIAAVIAIGTLIAMVSTRGHWGADSALALAALALAAFVQLNLSLRQAVLRIGGFQNATYFADLVAAGLRAVTALGLFAFAIRLTSPVMVAIALSSAVALMLLHRRYPTAPAPDVGDDRDGRGEVVRYILPMTPAVLLFAMQDLVIYAIVWLTTGATLVANIFALGRISALIAMIGGLITVVVMPRIANMADGAAVLRKGFAVTGLIGAFLAGAGAMLWLFPAYALLLIGSRYAHLQDELLLSFAIASLGALAGSVSQLNRAMGWVRGEPVVAGLQLLLLLALFGTQQVATTAQVLMLWLIVAALYCAMLLATTLTGMFKPHYLLSNRS